MSRIAVFLDRLMRRKVPASVFVTMNPQMQAVRIAVRENGRQSFEDYIREQVAACSRSSVVPDHTLLHLTFPDSKAIPSRRSTTNEYFYGKLAPAFIRQDIHPEPAVSLRDAAFALSKGLSPLSPAGRREQLMRDSEYRRFTMHCARTAPDDAPLYRAVTSSQGTYLFSDTPKGRRAMYCYMQYMTDRFFGMRTDADTLKIYELKHLPPRIAAMADKCIDKFVKSDLKASIRDWRDPDTVLPRRSGFRHRYFRKAYVRQHIPYRRATRTSRGSLPGTGHRYRQAITISQRCCILRKTGTPHL